MSKSFRPWRIDETQLLPASVQDFVGKDHLARLVESLVREQLSLAEISASYSGEKGQPPYHPEMMTALLLYSHCSGVYSSRRIAKASRERTDFLMIVALDPPDFRTVSEFRRRHLAALSGLFTQVLRLCEKAGLVKLGHVALDGTKIKANASVNAARTFLTCAEVKFPRLSCVSISRPADREGAFSAAGCGVAVALSGTAA
jgi:transposase